MLLASAGVSARVSRSESTCLGSTPSTRREPHLSCDEVEMSAPFLLGAGAELAPFGACFVGGDESGKGAGASGRCRFACGEAIGGPPFRIWGAIRIERSTGQLDALSRALGAAEGVIREILLAARRRAMDVRRELQSTFARAGHWLRASRYGSAGSWRTPLLIERLLAFWALMKARTSVKSQRTRLPIISGFGSRPSLT